MSTDHDLGGLLTPSESSFSGITDTSISTVDTTDDALATAKPSAAAVAQAGAEPHAPEVPAAIAGEPTALPRGHMRKSSTSKASGANGATSRTRGAARSSGTGRLERTKSQGSSRSRSPGGPGRGVGLGGLMMTMTTVVVADSGDPPIGGGQAVDKPKKAGGAMRVAGKRPGLGTRRTLSAGRVVSMGHAGNTGKGKEKRPAFNIGSNSDEGGGLRSHSKSVGSGSDTGKGVSHMPANLGVPHGSSASSSPVRVDPPAVQPQLPQPRKMVLATDDSEDYETETDSDGASEGELRARDLPVDKGKSAAVVDQENKSGDGAVPGEDDGEWASEETGDEDQRPIAHNVAGQKHGVSGGSGGRARHQARIHPLHQQPQPQQHYHHRPAAHQANPQQQHPGRHAKRLQAEAQARLAKHTVEHAALEAERLRDMFVRKPVPSSEQLAAMRSKSVGLLTQLLNPDPRIFPVGHPYRRGFSSGEIAVGGGGTGSGPVVGYGDTGDPREDSRSRNDASARRQYGGGDGRMPRGLPPMAGVGAPGLKLTKSTAALPVASVGSVIAVQATKSDGGGRTSPKASGSGRGSTGLVRSPDSGMWSNGMSGGYRPRGRPADQELDTESDSEEEGKGKNAILLSKSVAQEKLKALAMKRGIKPSTGAHGGGNPKKGQQQELEELEPVPEWARSETAVGNGSRQQSSSRLRPQDSRPVQQQQQQTTGSRQVSSPPPVPIPVGHPYNLPLPAPPSTPRTTRRLMLQTEMSESLRRNLLWERQVSKNAMAGFRRTNSSGDASGSGTGRRGNVLGGGVQPFTGALPPVVQLTPKKGKGVENGNEAEEEPRKPLNRAELEKRALARTKTWANDFHFVGW